MLLVASYKLYISTQTYISSRSITGGMAEPDLKSPSATIANTLEDGSGCGHLNSSFILVEYPSSPSQARSTHPDDLQPHEEEMDHDHNLLQNSGKLLHVSQSTCTLDLYTMILKIESFSLMLLPYTYY